MIGDIKKTELEKKILNEVLELTEFRILKENFRNEA